MSDFARVPTLDTAFVARWSPARLAMVGLIGYVAVYIFAPLRYDYSVITEDGAVYAIGVLIVFFAGCMLGRAINGAEPVEPEPVFMSPDRFINIAAGIGAVGVLARVYDRFFLRGFSIEQTYSETRESLNATVTAWGYIGGLCFVFGMVALVLMFLSSSQRRRPMMFVFVLLLALYPTFESLLQASRSTMLNTAFIFFFFARSANTMKWISKSPVALMVAGALLAVFSQFIFETRSLQDHAEVADIAQIYKEQGLAVYAAPQDWIADAISVSGGQGLGVSVLKTWAHFSQYLTHSWVVYFTNYNHFDGVRALGRLSLSVPLRVLGLIFDEDMSYDTELAGMESGVFGSFLSSLYYDFGALGPLMAGLFGFVVTLVHKRAILMPERWLPLHALISYTCLFMIVDNPLLGGIGSLAIWAFIAYVPLHYFVSMLSQPAPGSAAAAGETEPESIDPQTASAPG